MSRLLRKSRPRWGKRFLWSLINFELGIGILLGNWAIVVRWCNCNCTSKINYSPWALGRTRSASKFYTGASGTGKSLPRNISQSTFLYNPILSRIQPPSQNPGNTLGSISAPPRNSGPRNQSPYSLTTPRCRRTNFYSFFYLKKKQISNFGLKIIIKKLYPTPKGLPKKSTGDLILKNGTNS